MSAIIDVLAKAALFSTLDEDALGTLCEEGRTINLDCRGHLFQVGERANAYYLMTSGVMRLYRPGLDGEDKVFQVVGEGDLVAETAMFAEPCIYPLSAEAESPCTLIRLPRTWIAESGPGATGFCPEVAGGNVPPALSGGKSLGSTHGDQCRPKSGDVFVGADRVAQGALGGAAGKCQGPGATAECHTGNAIAPAHPFSPERFDQRARTQVGRC